MPLLDQCPDATASPASRTAAMQVARFRAALDWMLAHPLWEDHFTCSLNELGFKGQRQGIAQRSALRSLPIEQKQALARHALEQGLPAPNHAEAKRVALKWGVTQYQGRSDLGRPSKKQWATLQQTALIRISARYQQYKTAQSELFARYQKLPIEGALSACRTPSRREDACQEARLALLESIDRIDPSENFEAYARQCIKRRVLNFLMQERMPVKAPINLISKSFRGEKGAHPILEKAIREGTVHLDNELDSIQSRDAALATEAEAAPCQAAMASDESEWIAAALCNLTDKQREVVELRFGLGAQAASHSLAQIAAKTGISRQQVFQREKRALHALKAGLAELQAERCFRETEATGA